MKWPWTKPDCRFCNALAAVDDKARVAVVENGILFVGGKLLTDGELSELQAEITLLRESKLWGIINMTLNSQAIQMGLTKSTNFDQTLVAKGILHYIGVVDSLMKQITQEFQQRLGKK